MKHLRRLILGVAMWLVSQSLVVGQIDTTLSADFLVEKILVGSGVLIGNTKFTGEKHAIGLYKDSTNQIGIEEGIVLTSGNAFYVLGPNKTPRSGWASNAPGDQELEKIARGKTHDASILEFDFVTRSENLSFEFVFASEEYLEYVGSQFNDVFAFFITTPNHEKINIAKLPDGVTPITVNTVNHELNQDYYIDNAYTNTTDPFIWDVRNRKVINNENYLKEEQPPKYFIQFDGFTTVLKAQAIVVPNEVYHIKIAIADVGDGILDSGVFLKGGSFKSTGEQYVEIDDEHFLKIPNPQILKKKSTADYTNGFTKKKIRSRLTFGNIEFDFDQSILTNVGKDIIDNVYKNWTKAPSSKIEVHGHTDNFGSDSYNITLSEKRAKTVARALISAGIPKENVIIKFHGESNPINTNQNGFGRARNRRVECILIN